MKLKLIPLLLLTLLPLSRAAAQKEARTVFVQMPDSILPLLTEVNGRTASISWTATCGHR